MSGNAPSASEPVSELERQYKELFRAREHLLTQPIDYQVWTLADKAMNLAHAALIRLDELEEQHEKIAADYAEAQVIITRQHAQLWLVGLETHEDEERQPILTSLRNLVHQIRSKDEPET